MRRLAPVLLLSVVCCREFDSGSSRNWPEFHRPAASAEDPNEELILNREIHIRDEKNNDHWVGYLKGYRHIPQGERDPREFHRIFDTRMNLIGYINEYGTFFRYVGHDLKEFGRYPLLDGLKLFFGYRIRNNLTLEEVNPYRD